MGSATLLGHSGGTTATDVSIASLAASVAAGDALVVCGGANSSITTFGVSDAGSNSYSFATGNAVFSSATPTCATGMAVSQLSSPDSSGSTLVPVLNTGARGRQVFSAIKLDGLAASALDKVSSNSAGSAGPTATPGSTGTLTQADEIALFQIITPNAVTVTTDPPGGWALVDSFSTIVGSNERRITVYALVVSDTTALNPAAGLSGNSSWAASIATFKLAAAPPPSSGPSFLPFLPIR